LGQSGRRPIPRAILQESKAATYASDILEFKKTRTAAKRGGRSPANRLEPSTDCKITQCDNHSAAISRQITVKTVTIQAEKFSGYSRSFHAERQSRRL